MKLTHYFAVFCNGFTKASAIMAALWTLKIRDLLEN